MKGEYEDLLNLVEKKANEYEKEITEETGKEFEIFSFIPNQKWILNYYGYAREFSNEKIDTFTKAAILVKSIISKKSSYPDNEIDSQILDFLLKTKLEIAFRVAFELISSPKVYKKTSEEEWKEVECEKVEIVIPTGVNPKVSLHDNIMNDAINNEISIIQLSNLFHLIYLYSKDCKK